MQIVQKSRMVQKECYGLDFQWGDRPGAGFSFPCDARGNILADQMQSPEGRLNLGKCLSGEYAITPLGVRDYSYSYVEPALGRCSCGRIVELLDFTNTCDGCGNLYNLCGQPLVPREQWEEPWDED